MPTREVKPILSDKSNGYEEVADHFMSARNPRIGVVTVREWSQALPPRASILDLGCGHGIPISQTLIEEGFTVYGVDASMKLIAAFRKRFPNAPAECSAVEDSELFRRTFDGVVVWGLMFLLPADLQSVVIHKIARALNPGGNFLFTAPKEIVRWRDSLTNRESISLGAERYQHILRSEGLVLVAQHSGEGDNHYYSVSKPPGEGGQAAETGIAL
jgi:2-polyprenyl-3-methyl-5-hydroxy-6-metoxy-1,4-benzoquinol methylase